MALIERINQARKDGYSDDEIYSHLRKKAERYGYTEQELNDYLGQKIQPAVEQPTEYGREIVPTFLEGGRLFERFPKQPELSWTPPIAPRPQIVREEEITEPLRELSPEGEKRLSDYYSKWAEQEFQRRYPGAYKAQRGERNIIWMGSLVALDRIVPAVLGQAATKIPAFGAWVSRHHNLAPLLARSIEGGLASLAVKRPETPLARQALEGAATNTIWFLASKFVKSLPLLLKGKMPAKRIPARIGIGRVSYPAEKYFDKKSIESLTEMGQKAVTPVDKAKVLGKTLNYIVKTAYPAPRQSPVAQSLFTDLEAGNIPSPSSLGQIVDSGILGAVPIRSIPKTVQSKSVQNLYSMAEEFLSTLFRGKTQEVAEKIISKVAPEVPPTGPKVTEPVALPEIPRPENAVILASWKEVRPKMVGPRKQIHGMSVEQLEQMIAAGQLGQPMEGEELVPIKGIEPYLKQAKIVADTVRVTSILGPEEFEKLKSQNLTFQEIKREIRRLSKHFGPEFFPEFKRARVCNLEAIELSEPDAMQIAGLEPQAFAVPRVEKLSQYTTHLTQMGKYAKTIFPEEAKPPGEVTPVPITPPPTPPTKEPEFIDKTPPIGLSIKKVIPPGITIEKEPPDLKGFNGWMGNWMLPVRFAAKLHPVAWEIARRGRNAMLHFRALTKSAGLSIETMYSGIKKEKRQLIAQFLDKEVTEEELNSLSIKEREAYHKSREFLLRMKEVASMIKGVDVGKWSIPDDIYYPHIFVGSYEIMSGDKVLGFAKKLGEAIDQAEGYLKLNPGIDIRIRPKDIGGQFTATLLSRKGFWKFVNEVSNATEMDKEDILALMQGVAAIKPRGKFVGNFLQRVANLGGYIDDPEVALKIYAERVFRKFVFDPFKKGAYDLASKLPPGLREYFNWHIDDLGGKFDPINMRFQISRVLGKITRAQAFLKLGYRPSSAAINRLQPFHTTYAEIGNYLFRGRVFKHTPLGKKLIETSEVTAQLPKYYALEELPAAAIKFYHPLWLFSQAEQANRSDTVSGGYLFASKVFRLPRYKALKQGYEYILKYLDMVNVFKEEWLAKNPNIITELNQAGVVGDAVDKFIASLEYAKDLVADTQYIYDSSDLARIFRSRGGRVVFQFKNYTLNATIQAASWIKDALVDPNPHNVARVTRLIGSNIALGGIKLPLFALKQAGEIIHPIRAWNKKIMLAILGAILMHKKENRQKAAMALNMIYRGVFSILGVDISERIAPDVYVPRNVWDWFGVTAGDIASIVRAYREGKPLIEVVLQPWLLGRRIYEVTKKEDIEEMRRGRKIITPTPWEKFLYTLGFLPSRVADIRDFRYMMNVDMDEYQRLRAVYIDKIINAMDKKRPQEVIDSIYQDAESKGVPLTPKDIWQEMIAKTTPSIIRGLKRTPRTMRQQYAPFIREYAE